MGLFDQIRKTRLDEIMRINNLKEKHFIQVISELTSENQLIKEKAATEIKKLKDELTKIKGK